MLSTMTFQDFDANLAAVMLEEDLAHRSKRSLRSHPIYDSLAESKSDFDRRSIDIGTIVTPTEKSKMEQAKPASLYTNLFAIAHSFDPAMSHEQWQQFCANHPVAPAIISEVSQAFAEGRNNELMDELEKRGFLPAYNRSTFIFSLTFAAVAAQEQHHNCQDFKNGKLIAMVNETPVLDEHKPLHSFEDNVGLTWLFQVRVGSEAEAAEADYSDHLKARLEGIESKPAGLQVTATA